MTPEARTSRISSIWFERLDAELEALICGEIREAIEEEREACARIAEGQICPNQEQDAPFSCGDLAAEEIRMRSQGAKT